ncbi:hypothetical protein WA588_002356 [Blastocystis sp. NMH]
MSEGYNIGIDFGTSNCVVSVFENGRVRTIPIDNGKKALPSCVYVGDKATVVGREAQRKQTQEPKRVLCDVKRLLGCVYSEDCFQKLLPSLPYSVKRTDSDGIMLCVETKNGVREMSPVEAAGTILANVVSNASDYLKGPINEAVITVPAFFNNVQRNDMINAGLVAGLQRVHLFSEPTAAAISYGLINTCENELLLVFDFGAGALDVSLIQITGRTFTVIGSSGDSHLGGDDITEILVEEAARSFQETFGKDVRSSASELQKLREAVEEGKKALSSVESYDVDEQLLEEDFHYRMTREGLERSARPLLERCLAKVEEVLGLMSNCDAMLTHVLLVGGSCNIPFLRGRLTDRFGKKRVVLSANAAEAVSQGAAVIAGVSRDVTEKTFDFQVAMYTTTHNRGNDTSAMSQLQVLDITPMNIGIRVSSGRLSTIIPASSSVPYEMHKEYQAHRDGQTRMKFRIFQGLAEMADDCKLINELVVPIETPGPISETVVEVTFSLDSNSTLYVKAVEQRTMKTISRVLDMGSQALDRDTVYRMRDAVAETLRTSKAVQKAELERSKLQKTLAQSQVLLESLPTGPDIERKMEALKQHREWLNAHEDVALEEYVEQRQLVNELMDDE